MSRDLHDVTPTYVGSEDGCRHSHRYSDLPGGHSEGYDDTFKQVFRRFYASIGDPSAQPEYPQFVDGLRQLNILESELASHARRGWVDVPAFQAATA